MCPTLMELVKHCSTDGERYTLFSHLSDTALHLGGNSFDDIKFRAGVIENLRKEVLGIHPESEVRHNLTKGD